MTGHDADATITGSSFAKNVESLGIVTSTRRETSSWWPEDSWITD